MPDVKAIQTVYNGYKFRSRLEARWAVFFDSSGIEYVYEPEGYVLKDGSTYLPDFYLPFVGGRWADKPGVFIEVKGVLSGNGIDKIEKSGLPIYAVMDIPLNNNDVFRIADEHLSVYTDIYPYSYIYLDGDSYPAAFYKCTDGSTILCGPDHVDSWSGFDWFNKHYEKARKARFEHGERG